MDGSHFAGPPPLSILIVKAHSKSPGMPLVVHAGLEFEILLSLPPGITGVCHDAQESNPGLMKARQATNQLNYTPCPLGLPICFGDGSYYAAQARFEFIMHPICP